MKSWTQFEREESTNQEKFITWIIVIRFVKTGEKTEMIQIFIVGRKKGQ